MWLKKLCLSFLIWGLSGCVTVRDGKTCSVAGVLSAGGICAHLLTSETHTLSFNEFLDFLEAQPERTCVPVPGFNVCADKQIGTALKLPPRGASIVMSAQDWGTLKSELEQACRELGSHCSVQTQKLLGVYGH